MANGCTLEGPIGSDIRVSVDDEGHRTYTVPFLVKGVVGQDGPANVLNCPGLPRRGVTWQSIFPSDIDTCAWCRPARDVQPHPETRKGTAPEFWIVTLTFSSKPQEANQERCIEDEYCNPMDEPQKVSFEYSNYTEEASYDRFGRRVLSSSHEPIHGPANEWEFTDTTVVIEQNVEDPQLTLIEQMKDTLNDREQWGFPPRTIRFKPGSLVRHFRNEEAPTGTGPGPCSVYYTRILRFMIRYRRRIVGNDEETGTSVELTPIPAGPFETWDRDVWDEGTRVLRGYWSNEAGATGTGTSNRTHWTLVNINGSPPDPDNPQHFIRFKDWNGENQRTLLDGAGKPAFVTTITYEWWVLQVSNTTTLTHTYSILYLPCKAALKAAKNVDTPEVIVQLFGPFTSEADAQDAIDGSSLGDPVDDQDCDDTPSSVGVVHIERYGQSNHFLLGIPENLDLPLAPFQTP